MLPGRSGTAVKCWRVRSIYQSCACLITTVPAVVLISGWIIFKKGREKVDPKMAIQPLTVIIERPKLLGIQARLNI